jgi:archaellum component FlaC
MARGKLMSTTRNVNNVTNRIEKLSAEISNLTCKLQDWFKTPLEQLSAYYDKIVDTIEELCKKINEKFHLS